MKALTNFLAICKSDHGGSLMELALVCPILFVLLFAAVDLGRAFFVDLEVASAAHAGAEFGSQNPSNTAGMQAAAKQNAPDLTNLTVATPAWGCECSDGTSYSASCGTTPNCTANSSRGSNVVHRVQVTASVSYSTLLPWPGLSSPITLTSTATVRGN